MELSKKKVSIIIPCYNHELYIAEAIESALNQTYKNIEIVVINDASTDNSENIINTYAQKYKNIVFLNKKENKGVVFCRNLAISKSSGEYILPLDGDDKIAPTFVEKAVSILNNSQNVRIAYSRVKYFGANEKEFELGPFSPESIIFSNCITNTSMYRKDDFLAVGGYKEYMNEGLEDWDLWLSILEIAQNKKECAYKIDEILFFYRLFETKSRNTIGVDVLNKLYLLLIINHYSLYCSLPYFYSHISRALPANYKKKNRIIKILKIFIFILLFIILLLVLKGENLVF